MSEGETKPTAVEYPKFFKPWVNLVTFVGVPLATLILLGFLTVMGIRQLYADFYPLARQIAVEHVDFMKTAKTTQEQLTKTTEQNARNTEQQVENNAQLINVQQDQTRVMGSIDKHLEVTDKRLEHIETDVKDIKIKVMK